MRRIVYVLLAAVILVIASIACGDSDSGVDNNAIGASRSNPMPMSQSVSSDNWVVQVMEVIRGDIAEEMIADANMFNNPPEDGEEYLLVKVKLTCAYDDGESHNVGLFFSVTGDQMVVYDSEVVVVPEPALLSSEMFSGGTIEGWAAFSIPKDEENLILIFDDYDTFGTDDIRFIRLEY